MAKKNNTKNLFRKSLQLTIVLLLAYMVIRLFVDPDYIADFEAYCPLGGLQALSSYLISNTLACSMTETQIFMGLMLMVGVFLFSKLFCSFICPIGTFTEWLGNIGAKFKMRYTISGIADRGLRVLKYGLLFVTFYFTIGSSELFCKEYDPFYAIFSGFDNDVYLWYAIPALAITILGAVFIRQFWCKYLCPLGAASNIFSNGIVFAGIMVIYLAMRGAGLDLSWVWPLAAVSIMGFLLETTRMRGWIFPPLKITRDDNICTNCGLCDKACPMGIEVSKENPVQHIDCHLCGDCIYACPTKDTLQINRRNTRWLPASATVTMVIIGLFLSSTLELPTINMRWGDKTKLETAAVFNMSGLKNIKCYGSSMSFASKMKRINGVLGVETFVKTKSVKVLYDPEVLDDDKIKTLLFSPSKTLLRTPPKDLAAVQSVEMGIDKLFDSYDSFYLTQLLRQTEGVFGFETNYGEPVHTIVYFDSSNVQPQTIKTKIESQEVTYKSRGKEYTKPLKFKVRGLADTVKAIVRLDFIQNMFRPFKLTFNDYKDYSADQLSVYRIHMPQAMIPALRRSMNSLVSHVSTDSFVVRFETLYDDKPYADIYFVTGQSSADSIYSALKKEQMTVHYRNGKTGEVKNPFKFPAAGKILDTSKKN